MGMAQAHSVVVSPSLQVTAPPPLYLYHLLSAAYLVRNGFTFLVW